MIPAKTKAFVEEHQVALSPGVPVRHTLKIGRYGAYLNQAQFFCYKIIHHGPSNNETSVAQNIGGTTP